MADKPKDNIQSVAAGVRLWSLAGDIGFKIALPLILFLLAGIYLDRTLNTTPLFMLMGIVLAMASSAYLIYQIILSVSREQA